VRAAARNSSDRLHTTLCEWQEQSSLNGLTSKMNTGQVYTNKMLFAGNSCANCLLEEYSGCSADRVALMMTKVF